MTIGRVVVLIIAAISLSSCGEMPQDRHDREQREDTLRWLERRELDRDREQRKPTEETTK